MSSFATPNTSARWRVRSSQARCGSLHSFCSYTPTFGTAPAAPLGLRMSCASLYSSWLTTDSACTAGTCEDDAGLAEQTVGPVEGYLTQQAVQVVLDQRLAQLLDLTLLEGAAAQLRLEHALLDPEVLHTGPVTVNPVPSSTSMFTTSAITEATIWTS